MSNNSGNLPSIVVAAVLKKSSREVVGYRLVCLDDGKVDDIATADFIRGYKSNKVNVLNAKVTLGYKKDILGNPVIGADGNKITVEEVTGEGMSLNNLPQVMTRLDPKDPMYITKDTKNNVVYAVRCPGNTHKVVDFGGKILLLDERDFRYYKSNLVNIEPLIDETIDISKIMSVPLDKRKGKFDGNTTGMNVVSKELRDKTAQQLAEKEANKQKPTMAGVFALADGDDSFVETDRGNIYTTYDGGLVFDFAGNDELNDYKRVGNIGAGYKFATALMCLRNLNYFYYSLLQELNRKLLPADFVELKTMAVSPSVLYANVGFIDEHSIEELTFVLMHEAMHLLFRHNYYGINKNQEIHNIAADLIINKMITDEYGCLPGNKSPVRVSTRGGEIGIKYCEDGVWLEAIDTTVDTSESVYHELITQIQPQLNNMKSQGKGNSQGQQGQSQGQQQGQSQGQQQGQSQGQQQGQSQGQQQGQSQGQQQGQSQGQSQGQGGVPQVGQNGESFDITFRGTKITINPKFRDIVLSKEDAEKGKEGIGDKTTELANKAQNACKVAGQEMSPLIQATLKIESVIVRPSWRRVLKQFLSKFGEKYYTYAAVNKRYLHMGLHVPGPKTSEENSKKLKNIVLAIDTSGSMFSDENLSKIVSLACSIVKQYDADGDIIYWDTSVTSTGRFKDTKSLVRTDVKGGGGTDINCLFEYLDKKYPKKNDMPSLVMVMTDGYFGTLEEKYVKKYKNVIWAITEPDLKAFNKPENGKVARIDM